MAQSTRLCAICNKRRARRFCPGVSGDICPICCGTEREVTVNCPLDCIYLQEARRHEPLADVTAVPNADIQVDERFLRRNEPLFIVVAAALAAGALGTEGALDRDVREALAALVRTHRTLQSGLVYESRPENPIAARISDAVTERVTDLRTRAAEHGHSIRGSDLLGVFAFLERLSLQHDNGRPKGRAFIDFLRGFLPPHEARGDTIVSPDTSLIELP